MTTAYFWKRPADPASALTTSWLVTLVSESQRWRTVLNLTICPSSFLIYHHYRLGASQCEGTEPFFQNVPQPSAATPPPRPCNVTNPNHGPQLPTQSRPAPLTPDVVEPCRGHPPRMPPRLRESSLGTSSKPCSPGSVTQCGRPSDGLRLRAFSVR